MSALQQEIKGTLLEIGTATWKIIIIENSSTGFSHDSELANWTKIGIASGVGDISSVRTAPGHQTGRPEPAKYRYGMEPDKQVLFHP